MQIENVNTVLEFTLPVNRISSTQSLRVARQFYEDNPRETSTPPKAAIIQTGYFSYSSKLIRISIRS